METLLATALLGVLAMGTEMLGGNARRLVRPLLMVAILVAIGLAIRGWNQNETLLGGMMVLDNYAIAFSVLLLGTAGLLLPMAGTYLDRDMSKHQGDVLAVMMFAVAGGVCMTAYQSLVMLFVGLEILSIGFYILAGTRKRDLLSNEAAFKYFLLGAFSTGFLLFGITLLYGVTGSFDLENLRNFAATQSSIGELPMLFNAGVLLLLVGLLFKISAVPFHFWAPDVYEGAPTWITVTMATVVKTASYAALLRLMMLGLSTAVVAWAPIITVVATLTLIVGNVLAAIQPGVKRLLAMSSISHAGYLLFAIVGLSENSGGTALLYLTGYCLASLATFAVLMQVIEKHGDDAFERFNGLGRSNPLLAGGMTIGLLSMAGIPPLAGFFGKYLMFQQVLTTNYAFLAVVGVLAALAGAYYYFKIIIAMYSKPIPQSGGVAEPAGTRFVLIVTMVGTVLLGVLPTLLTSLEL